MSIIDNAGALLFGGSSNGITSEDGTVKVIPNLVVRETHQDRVQTTAQPVEYGAAITDHAFRLSPSLQLQYGWSNSSIAAISSNLEDLESSSSLVNFGETYVNEMYQKLLTAFEARTLCTVVTSKRVYDNILIVGLSTDTTAETAYSMVMNIECAGLLRASARVYKSISVQNSGSKNLNPVSQTPSVAGA